MNLFFIFSGAALRMMQSRESRDSDSLTSLSFLPSISVVRSLPLRGDWCTELARRSCDWSKNLALADGKSRSPQKRVSSKTDGRCAYLITTQGFWGAL